MKSILLITTITLLSSCAHHKDVRPNSTGNHTVSFQVDTKQDGYRNAIDQANHFCKERNQNAFIVKETNTYVGSMNEKDYNTTKKVAQVAKSLGGTIWALGGKKESNAGGVVGLGGGVADQVAGKGYQYQMTFNCK